METRSKILAIDDDLCSLGLINLALNDQYDVICETSGFDCLEKAENISPDLILLDIQMPKMDGYETCRKLKINEKTKHIPVTFVSAKDSLQERITGYEVGADDYIIKPFHEEELIKKVAINIHNQRLQHQMRKELDFTRDTAMVAMSSSGELGLIVGFLSQTFYCDSLDSLGQQILEIMGGYGLDCSVQLGHQMQTSNFNRNGVVKPLEASLLERLKDAGRITDFGKRTFINFPYCRILIKNMPVEDEQRYGRIKDNVALLAEGANARVRALETSADRHKQREQLKALVQETHKTLKDIDAGYNLHKQQNTQILDSLALDIEESFLSLGLTEDQEQFIMNRITKAHEAAIGLYENGIELDQRLQNITEKLNINSSDNGL